MDINKMFTEGLRQKELEHEKGWIQSGVAKYLERAETKSELHMNHVQNLTAKMIKPFTTVIEEYIKDSYGRRGFPNSFLNCEQFISTRQMSYLSVSVFKDIILKKSKFASEANKLNRHLISTMKMNIYLNKKLDDSERQAAIDKIDSLKSPGLILTEIFFNTFALYYEPEMEGRKALKNEAGELIYNVNVPREDFPNYFRITRELNSRAGNLEIFIEASEELKQLLEQSKSEFAFMSYSNKPMLMRPDDWNKTGDQGGYYLDLLKMTKDLDRNRNICKLHAFKSRNDKNMSVASEKVLRAVNAIQSTPWQVNDYILQTFLKLEETRPESLEKIYPALPLIPEKPKKLPRQQFLNLSKEEQQEIKTKMSEYLRACEKEKAKQSIDMDRESAITQAKEYLNYSEIYFPYDLDYRGRIYSMAMSGLNPQGSDLSKGLIHFAQGHKIKTANGLKWLRINMANFMGYEKLKLKDRIEKCIELESELKKIVDDPIKNDQWHSWDKPVQGLACAHEYVNYLRNPDYEVKIHVQLDGLCNGLQNLCATTKDEINAPNLGLVKTEERGDIYQYIADKIIEELNNIISKEDENLKIANNWLNSGLIDRNFSKKPVNA